MEKNEAEPWEKTLERNVDKNAVERTLTQVLDLHERLVVLGSEPVPYKESDWVELRDSLPDRIQHRRVFGGGRLARPLIAASMVVGLTAGAAAASPTVREHMVSVWHGIQHIGRVNDPTPSRCRLRSRPCLLERRVIDTPGALSVLQATGTATAAWQRRRSGQRRRPRQPEPSGQPNPR